MAKAVEKTIDIWKKKKWHKVLAPKLFNDMVIGETPSLEPNTLIGRTLKINMLTLTGDIKKQNIDITFEIEKVMGDTAYTRIKKFEINPAAVRRFIRRGKNRVDDSFICLTSDNKKVKVKPFLVTFSKTTNSVLCALRKRAREFFARAVKSTTYDNLCREIVTYNVQKAMRDNLKKIYPLRVCDVRVMEICEKEGVRVLEVIAPAVPPRAQEAPKAENIEAEKAEEKPETAQEMQEEAPKSEEAAEEEKPKKKAKKDKKDE
ncbi:hypothetical protein COV19_06210 [Candidatus Woesearchaeota archaeon CG10_big_fil_rev_8_21_14_0_10_44_13]|nr:MAG: hypothetical protein COV19_06210 [Candidatus Woesearchaeota archaeon CG10_big_fil_rev_8_21_14_0_10_44_13]